MRKWNFQAKGERAAEVRIYEEIGAGFFGGLTAKAFAEELDDLGDLEKLNVRINSVGGEIFQGLAIYNTLRRHPATVVVDVDGIAASIASVIAMAGDEVHMAENARLMIHNPWSIVLGDAAEMRKTADRLDQSRDTIVDIYAKRATKSKAELAAMMDEETWLSAEESKAIGFADSVVEDGRGLDAMRNQFDLSRFRHPPADLTNSGPQGRMKEAVEAYDAAQEVAVRLRVLDLDEENC